MENLKYVFLAKNNIENKKNPIKKILDDPFDDKEYVYDPNYYDENGVRLDFGYQLYSVKKFKKDVFDKWINKMENTLILNPKDEQIFNDLLFYDKIKLELELNK